MASEPTSRTGGPRPDPPQPLLGSAPTVRRSRWAAYTFSPARIVQVAGIAVLLVLGSVLPYLSMPYVNFEAAVTHKDATLFPAAPFVGGLDPLWLPNYQPGPRTGAIQGGLNLFSVAPGIQEICVVVALVTCAALFQNEINKFFWWPLHLSGWLLALTPILLLTGLHELHSNGVSLDLHPAWVFLALAGVVIVVTTLRARQRIDTYASI